MNWAYHLYILQLPAIIIAMGIHESVKAHVSTKLGDTTPKLRGRLTLNPLKHVEIIGLLLMLFFGYGWSQPTPVNPSMYRDYQKGVLATFMAPMLFNIVIGIALALVGQALNPFAGQAPILANLLVFIQLLARYCVALAIFNLIPVYPLDGARLLSLVLSPNARVKASHYEKVFLMILVILLFLGIVGQLLDPVVNAILGGAGSAWR